MHIVPAGGGHAAGYSSVPEAQRKSTCSLEVLAPWRSLQTLTPDATQLALGDSWTPEAYR